MVSRAYSRYVLALSTAVNTLSCLDQGLIALCLQPIKNDLHLSDTQLGFLTGIAFALFYATLGVPIARWADQGNRTVIASVAIAMWGATVMLCLFVRTFAQLVFVRILTAVGESGCQPATYSLVGDYFPESAERTRAMAIYWLGGPLAAFLSFGAGGWLNERYGWRAAFFLMGIPGVLLAVVVRATLREPRIHALAARATKRPPPRLYWLLSMLWRQRSTRHLIIGLVLLYAMGLGMSPWYATIMMRDHGVGTAEIGIWFGLIFGIGGAGGVLAGGYVAGSWLARDERAQMRFSALTVAALMPCSAAFLLLSNRYHALIAFVPLAVVFNVFLAPTYALLQRLVADEMRATTLAIVSLLCCLIGAGVGPQAVGVLSDSLAPLVGNESLRDAMLVMSSVALWSAYHFWLVGQSVREDLEAAKTDLLKCTPTTSTL